MDGRVVTNVKPAEIATYSAPAGVRLEMEDEVRGTFNILFYGNESLKLGVDLIKAYLAHCALWFREKIIPFSSK